MTAKEARGLINQEAAAKLQAYRQEMIDQEYNNIVNGIKYQCQKGERMLIIELTIYNKEHISQLMNDGFSVFYGNIELESGAFLQDNMRILRITW